MINIPNLLTLSRLAILPVIILLILTEGVLGENGVWLAFILYIIAAATDFVDGWLARKLNQTSDFGTFLDPISDKIFIGALLIIFAGVGRIYGLWLIPAVLILSREILVSGLREYLGPKNIQLPVTKLAKWKTTAQMLALGLLIIGPYIPFGLITGHIALTGAAIITLITGWEYMKVGLDHMKL
ncbi:MAG: CDP-diacylglycerol--glycerol-3-phosphate 3-phosphatidyltransferase [Alphaproteobacteria bacterium]